MYALLEISTWRILLFPLSLQYRDSLNIMSKQFNLHWLFSTLLKKDKFNWGNGVMVTCFKSPLFLGFDCVEVLRPNQPNGVMSSAVSLPSHTFTGQA